MRQKIINLCHFRVLNSSLTSSDTHTPQVNVVNIRTAEKSQGDHLKQPKSRLLGLYDAGQLVMTGKDPLGVIWMIKACERGFLSDEEVEEISIPELSVYFLKV